MISNYSTEIVRTTALWMLLRKQIVNKGGWKKNLKTGQWPKKPKEVSTCFNQDAKAETGTKHALSSKHTRKIKKEDNTSRNSRNRKGNQTRASTAIRSWS